MEIGRRSINLSLVNYSLKGIQVVVSELIQKYLFIKHLQQVGSC